MEVSHDHPSEPSAPVAAEPSASRPGPAAGTVCAVHPRVAAVTRCSSCGKQLCTLCTFEVDGWNFCGDCAMRQADAQEGRLHCPECDRSMPAGTALCECGHVFEPADQAVLKQPRILEERCVNHPDAQASVYCKLCRRPICATCDFVLPGGFHLCPSCIEAQSSVGVNPKRKNMSYLSLGLAAWSTILFFLLLLGLFNSLLQSAGGDGFDRLITALIMWPALIGTALALGSLDKKLKNTALMKGALWWNAIIGVIFLMLILANNLGLTGK